MPRKANLVEKLEIIACDQSFVRRWILQIGIPDEQDVERREVVFGERAVEVATSSKSIEDRSMPYNRLYLRYPQSETLYGKPEVCRPNRYVWVRLPAA